MSRLAIGGSFAAWLAGGALLLGVSSGSAQTATQQFNLRAGWNAIWLEVEPRTAEIGAVFTNLPISSVWTYVPNGGTVQFIVDQNEASFNDPVWLRYFPKGRPEAFVNNLFAIHAGRAFLVNLSGPATLTVTGRPVIKQANWQANSYNLRGFPINPDQAPSFGSFFAPSTAHAGQPIHRLGADGKWSQVDSGTAMASGEAYWVYCRGGSTYQAPLGLELISDGLDFGVELTEMSPRLRNLEPSAKSVFIRDLITVASSPLSYFKFANNAFSWANLPAPHVVSLGGRASSTNSADLRLAIRRKDLPPADTNYSSILEIKDNAGTRYLLPVSAARLLTAKSSQTNAAAFNAPGAKVAGLWMGTASITKVNEPNSTNAPATPQPTRSPLTLRLLLHVTDQGEPRLLKEVLQMWQESTHKEDGSVDQPGRFVLLTDDSRIPNFSGAALRAGKPVGRRISTADYDFAAGSSNYLAMAGTFAVGQQASCRIVLSPNFPTNPFRHKYHPDHDNKDSLFRPLPAGLPPEQQEVYEITRALTLTFLATDPAGPNGLSAIEYGDSVIGGTYHESITGLHKAALEVEGTFRLTRVNNSPVLNQ